MKKTEIERSKGYILHINSYLKDRVFYKGMYEAFIKTGIRLRVYSPVPYHKVGRAKEVGEYVDVVECYNYIERYLFFLKQWKAIRQAKRLYNLSSVQLIHAHSMCTNGYVAYKLSQMNNIPYIITVRNGDLNSIYKKAIILRPVFNRVIRKSSKVIFLSEPYRDDVINKCVPQYMKKEIWKKSIVIPNGIDDYWFNNILYGNKLPQTPLRLLYVGEINRNKNISTLNEIVKQLNKEGLSAVLTVVGEIKDHSIKSYLSNRYITYKPKMCKEELLNEYRCNDIFIMISKKEAFGLVYIEAMTQGLPIIYTKNQGMDRQFNEGYVGFHVNCMDVEDSKKRIRDIVKNYESMSKNTKTAIYGFRWSKIVEKYIDVYDELINW